MGWGKNIAVGLAFLCGAAAHGAAEDCGESALAEDELKLVHSIYEFCKSVKGVAANSDVICFVSELNYKSWAEYQRATSLYRWSNQKYVYIDSRGGNIGPASNIAHNMIFGGKTLIVNEFCLSACANYIFTAAARRILLGPALVGWHGSPETLLSVEDKKRPGAQALLREYRWFLANFSTEYGERIQKLMNEPPVEYPYRGADIRKSIWSYPDDKLCKDFGIRNIIRVPLPSKR